MLCATIYDYVRKKGAQHRIHNAYMTNSSDSRMATATLLTSPVLTRVHTDQWGNLTHGGILTPACDI